MNHPVKIEDTNLSIKTSSHFEAFQIWKKLNYPLVNPHKKGHENKCYLGMSINYDKVAKNINDILTELHFEFNKSPNGDLLITGFNSNKGQEELFFGAISHLIDKGNYVVWKDEAMVDGYTWYFDGKKLIQTNHDKEIELTENKDITIEGKDVIKKKEVINLFHPQGKKSTDNL